LELVNKVDTDLDLKQVKKTIKNSVITMEIMEKEISETTSSLQYVDMSVYNEWLEKSKN
jgi:hypothetical protein